MLRAANDPFSALRFHVVEDRCHRHVPSASRGEIFEYLNNASIDFAALDEPIGNVRVDDAATLRLLETARRAPAQATPRNARRPTRRWPRTNGSPPGGADRDTASTGLCAKSPCHRS